jgi:catechol 2,3-dioxygenase-like lactoylglutathione lyase family enzyme
MLDHLGIQCADVAASAAFYDAVLAPLGGTRVMEHQPFIGYGVPPVPDFWIMLTYIAAQFLLVSGTLGALDARGAPVATYSEVRG